MILALFLACSGPRGAAELPVADPPPPIAEAAPADGTASGLTPVDSVAAGGNPAPGPQPTGLTAPATTPAKTPAEAYQGCRDRVEGIQTSGECKVDTDCTTTGCSQEVCVATPNAGDIMTTCEILPCFAVLEACGCHESQCTWTVAATMPPPRGPIPLPPRPR